EEVDNGLHPSRAGLLLKMLREIGEKRKIDILVTTYNPALLDALDPVGYEEGSDYTNQLSEFHVLNVEADSDR
ncbi:MAG: ATP-binding protein, partial [Coleofasciculus sp. S288]|nr:ATP-binding protein [Coleofasciculus sp. S288]